MTSPSKSMPLWPLWLNDLGGRPMFLESYFSIIFLGNTGSPTETPSAKIKKGRSAERYFPLAPPGNKDFTPLLWAKQRDQIYWVAQKNVLTLKIHFAVISDLCPLHSKQLWKRPKDLKWPICAKIQIWLKTCTVKVQKCIRRVILFG